MIDEEQVKNIVKKVLDEEHLTDFIKIFEKEHNLFRGSHDKIGLPEALEIHQTIINHIVEKFEDEAITTDKIADGAIVNKKLYDECVDASKIADEAVEEAKIALDAVTAAKIAVAGLDGETGDVAANHIVAEMLQAGCVVTEKLYAGAVTAPKIDVVGLDGETGRICVVDDVDADEIVDGINAHALTLIEPGKVLISGETDLSDWSHGVDATFIDGGKIYTQSITAAQILAGTITASEINVADFINLPSDENLVGYWSFDEGTGTLAVDGSGNGNDGTLTNMEEADWVDGKVGKCLDFDGENDWVDCGGGAELKPENEITISLWANQDVVAGGDIHDAVDHHDGYEIQERDDSHWRVYFKLSVSGWQFAIASGITNQVGQSYHVVATFDTTTGEINIYIDGVLEGTTDGFIGETIVYGGVDKTYIGSQNSGVARHFNGLIDEVRIYNRALTEAEIKALYLYPAGNKAVTISGGQIAAETITVDQILARTITADRIALGAITADEIAAGAITADEIDAGTITCDEIHANTITADNLAPEIKTYWYSGVSTNSRNMNVTERTTSSSTYVKVKEMKINEVTGRMNVHFGLLATEGGAKSVQGKIYKNGSPISGNEWSTSNLITWEYFEEAIDACAVNDLIQIYAKKRGVDEVAKVKDMTLRYDRALSIVWGETLTTPLPTVLQTPFSVTPQDP
ncbi:hypothetical protein ES705_05335 [subsurface metagenome]